MRIRSCPQTGGSSTLAQGFASWLQTNRAHNGRGFCTPDIDEFIASQYIRDLYPDLSLEDSITLMDNSRFMGKLASGEVPRHVHGHLLASRTSVHFTEFCDSAIQTFHILREKIKRKYPQIKDRLSMKRRRKTQSLPWKTSHHLDERVMYHFDNFSTVVPHPATPSASPSVESSPRCTDVIEVADRSSIASSITIPHCESQQKASPVDSLILNRRRNQDQCCSVSSVNDFYSPMTSPDDAFYTGSERDGPQRSDIRMAALFQRPASYYAPSLYVNELVQVR